MQQVRMLHSRMKFDYEQISDKKEFTTVKKYANQSKWCTLIIMFFLYFYGILLTSPSILNVILYFFGLLEDTQLTLPIPIGHILNAGFLYYAMLFYESIVIFIVATAALANYATYILLVQHACSQFSIIKMKINQPFEQNNSDISAWYDSAPQDEYTWIVDIIKRYRRVTELVDLTNSLIENIYLVEMFLGLFLIILDFLYLFQITALMQNKRETLMYFIYVVGSIFIIYLNFYVGQRLLDHSSKVFQELCNLPFYRISTKTQKLLLVLIMRSAKPCALSIGGMFVSSHEIFASLMQKAFSYAMVCYTMH
ncbi:hypothetical protein KPH14_005925 [Odynerus spinipes]|uniref:Odorant receptor n=1 Tax=Odynerus spinipes TaxID=1348599 RepID=A0AAD9VP25_9HYME|nr:hypothetical protein KPH14_005925 [Odynerus spinipes]